MLLIIKGFDGLIVHNRFIESKFSLIFNILFITDLNTALHGRDLAVVGVEAESHCHVEEVQWAAVKVNHAAQYCEFNGDRRCNTQDKALRTLNGSYCPIDRKHSVLAARFVEIKVEFMQVCEGIE